MNNFTKEELEMLMHGIHNTITEHTQERYAPLASKLERIIINYCEHKNLVSIGLIDGYDCENCNKRFDRTQIKVSDPYNKIKKYD